MRKRVPGRRRVALFQFRIPLLQFDKDIEQPLIDGVLDDTGSQVLLTLHPRLGRWVQLGGHCEDSDADIVAAALREATEESGVDGLRITPDLAAINVHALTCSLGVPTRHIDLQFVAHAPPAAQIAISDESDDLRWWPIDGLPPGTDGALAYLVERAQTSLE